MPLQSCVEQRLRRLQIANSKHVAKKGRHETAGIHVEVQVQASVQEVSKFAGSKIRSVRHPMNNTFSRRWLPFSSRGTHFCLPIETTHLTIAFVCVDGRRREPCVPAAPFHDVWRRLFAPHALWRLHSQSFFGLVRGCTCSSRRVLLGRHVRRASSTRTPHESSAGATSRFEAVLETFPSLPGPRRFPPASALGAHARLAPSSNLAHAAMRRNLSPTATRIPEGRVSDAPSPLPSLSFFTQKGASEIILRPHPDRSSSAVHEIGRGWEGERVRRFGWKGSFPQRWGSLARFGSPPRKASSRSVFDTFPRSR